MRSGRKAVVVCAVVGLASAADAMFATALVREDEQLSGLAPGFLVSSINNSAVNGTGGWSFTVNASDGSNTISTAWGHIGGACPCPGTVIFQEGTYAGFEQTAWESFFGMDDAGQIAYSPTVNRIGGPTGLDTVWVNDTPILSEEDPIPGAPGQFSSFNSRPGITRDGKPYWVGGLTSTPGGSTQERALFFGAGASIVIEGGVDTFLGFTVDNIDFDVRFSELGSSYLTGVDIDTGSSSNDTVLVKDGAVLTAGGGNIREGDLLGAGIGGLAGEAWSSFDNLGVNEAGDVFFTGDTTAAVAQDEFVFQNGMIVQREGDVVSNLAGDSFTISGSIEGGYQNGNGDWAVVWDVDTTGGNVEALIVNGKIVLMEGDAVDWNNDGVIDANDNNGKLADFTGIAAVTMSDRDGDWVSIYFTADIDFFGTSSSSDDLEAGMVITYRIPAPGAAAIFGLAGAAALRRRR